MIDSMYIGATGMQSQQLHVDAIANNLANVNTSGYKKSRITFEDAFYQAMNHPANIPDLEGIPIVLGMGVMVSGNSKVFTQGEIKVSQSPLDLAIRGNGFFEVVLPDGTSAYTRHGAFRVNSNGLLGTVEGYELKQQIEIPADIAEVVIDNRGKVSGRGADSTKLIELGQIELANFQSPESLEPIGSNLFILPSQAQQPVIAEPGQDSSGLIAQGYLEASNVNLSEEMVNLVLAQRAYELNAKVVQVSDEMLATSNNLRR